MNLEVIVSHQNQLIHWLAYVLTILYFGTIYLALCLIFECLLQAATKILARQLVRLRQQITNLQGSRAQIRGVATHTQVTLLLFSYICVILQNLV